MKTNNKGNESYMIQNKKILEEIKREERKINACLKECTINTLDDLYTFIDVYFDNRISLYHQSIATSIMGYQIEDYENIIEQLSFAAKISIGFIRSKNRKYEGEYFNILPIMVNVFYKPHYMGDFDEMPITTKIDNIKISFDSAFNECFILRKGIFLKNKLNEYEVTKTNDIDYKKYYNPEIDELTYVYN